MEFRGAVTPPLLSESEGRPDNLGGFWAPALLTQLLTRGIAVARGAAVIQDDLPLPAGFPPPHGIERASALAGRVANRSRRHCERARVEHLDGFGRPRERGGRTLEEGLPAVGHCFGATRHPATRQEIDRASCREECRS